MSINFELINYFHNKNSWNCLLLPSLGVGYCKGFLSVSLYLFVWEFDINFEFKE